MAGGTSVYVENETKIDYRKTVASKQLKRKVVALGIKYVDAANDMHTSDMRVLVGYTKDQLCIAYDPTVRKRNRAELAKLASMSVSELVSTNVVPAKYVHTVQIKSELGLLLDHDGTRKRARPGASFLMSFVVDGRQMQYDIVIPNAAPDTLTLLSADGAMFNVGKINFKVGKINFKVGKVNFNAGKINFKVTDKFL